MAWFKPLEMVDFDVYFVSAYIDAAFQKAAEIDRVNDNTFHLAIVGGRAIW